MNDKLIGYKMMKLEDGMLCSLASDSYKFPSIIGDDIEMDGKGVWLSTNKDFVIDYYSNPDHTPEEDCYYEALVTIEFNKNDITQGNIDDKEPVITVPKVKILNIQLVENFEVLEFNNEFLKNLKKQNINNSFKPN